MQITRMRKGKLVYPLMWMKLPLPRYQGIYLQVAEEVSDSGGVYGSRVLIRQPS